MPGSYAAAGGAGSAERRACQLGRRRALCKGATWCGACASLHGRRGRGVLRSFAPLRCGWRRVAVDRSPARAGADEAG